MWKFGFALMLCIHIGHSSVMKCKKASKENTDTALICEFTEITTIANTQKLSVPPMPSSVQAENVKIMIIKSEYDEYGEVEKIIIDQVPSEIFTMFPNINELEMKLDIKSLSSQDFVNATKLQKLKLNSNGIETIDDFTFANQNLLKELSLSKNKIKVIKQNTFKGLVELKLLNVDENEISVIEDGAFDLPTLEELDLDYNKVKTLPDSFPNQMRALKTLKMGINPEVPGTDRIENIDLVKFSKLPELKTLRFSFLNISLDNVNLGSESASVSGLEKLDFWGNDLKNATYLEVFHKLFPQLQTLELSHNKRLETFDLDKQVIRNWWPKLSSIGLIGTIERKKCQQLRTDFYETFKISVVCGWQ